MVRDVFMRWYHAYRLLVQNVLRLQEEDGVTIELTSDLYSNLGHLHTLDKWVIGEVQSLVGFVRTEMEAYRLHSVAPRLVVFIRDLSNVYVRLSLARFKAKDVAALKSLGAVLLTLCTAMAPFTPFFADSLYQNLRHFLPVTAREDSVHYLPYPSPVESVRDPVAERRVQRMLKVLDLAVLCRERRAQPLRHVCFFLPVLFPVSDLIMI